MNIVNIPKVFIGILKYKYPTLIIQGQPLSNILDIQEQTFTWKNMTKSNKQTNKQYGDWQTPWHRSGSGPHFNVDVGETVQIIKIFKFSRFKEVIYDYNLDRKLFWIQCILAAWDGLTWTFWMLNKSIHFEIFCECGRCFLEYFVLFLLELLWFVSNIFWCLSWGIVWVKNVCCEEIIWYKNISRMSLGSHANKKWRFVCHGKIISVNMTFRLLWIGHFSQHLRSSGMDIQ